MQERSLILENEKIELEDVLKFKKIIEIKEYVSIFQKYKFERLLSSNNDEIETHYKDVKKYNSSLS